VRSEGTWNGQNARLQKKKTHGKVSGENKKSIEGAVYRHAGLTLQTNFALTVPGKSDEKKGKVERERSAYR